MSSRFQRATSRPPLRTARPGGDGFGEWWAAIAIVALATIASFSLGGALPGGGGAGSGRTPAVEAGPSAQDEINRSLERAAQSIAAVDRGLKSLCNEPVLIALELKPDCKTGAMTIADSMFDGPGGNLLNRRSKEDVRAAVTNYLEAMRRKPALWDALESLEIRGHADPRAFRNAYTTNLVGSQQRALGLLYFLTGREGLSESDKKDLQRFATVSGASFSRPPESCPEAVRECYPAWRRVEILPIFSEARVRGEWARTVESVQQIVRRAEDDEENRHP